MGASLVKLAIAFGARHRLTGNEFRVLIQMAVTAKDTDLEPSYWSSREDSARALGRMIPDEPGPDDPDADAKRRERDAAFFALKEAIRGLRAAGAIQTTDPGRRGHRAVYKLTLTSMRGSENPPPIGEENPPAIGGNPSPYRGENPPPKEEPGTRGQKTRTTTRHTAPPHLGPVDSSSNKPIDHEFEEGAA